MVTFGVSAFLKILSSNDRPQKTAIRTRLAPSAGDGYDFHKRFRRLAHDYLVGGASLSSVLASAHTIVQQPERASAVAALKQLELWRACSAGEIIDFAPTVYESPRQLFRVKFEPDFGILIHGSATAFHLWNTKSVKLAPNMTFAALALVADAYRSQDDGPDDVGVLSLREPPTTYLLSQAWDHSAVAASIVEQIEDIMQGPAPPPSLPEDRPFG